MQKNRQSYYEGVTKFHLKSKYFGIALLPVTLCFIFLRLLNERKQLSYGIYCVHYQACNSYLSFNTQLDFMKLVHRYPFFYCIYLVLVCACTMTHMQKTEDHLLEPMLQFYHEGSRNQAQVIGACSMHLPQLSHLADTCIRCVHLKRKETNAWGMWRGSSKLRPEPRNSACAALYWFQLRSCFFWRKTGRYSST